MKKVGLKNMTVNAAVQSSHAAAGASSQIDVNRELGLELEETQYANRLLALTNPTAYADARAVEFGAIKAKTANAYQVALDGLMAAGMPTEAAKNLALQAAANERDMSRQILELRFPSGANAIGDASLVSRANSITGDLNRGIAPARRRAAPRRRTARRR